MNEQALEEITNSQTGSIVSEEPTELPKITPTNTGGIGNQMASATTTATVEATPVAPSAPVQSVVKPNVPPPPAPKPLQKTEEPKGYATVNDGYVQKVYDWAKGNGSVTIPYDQFKNNWFSSDETANQLYQRLNTAQKYENIGFKLGTFDDFKKQSNYSYQKPITDQQKQNISDGLNSLFGGIESTITKATDAIGKIPELFVEGGEAIGQGLIDLKKENPVSEKRDVNKIATEGLNPNLDPLDAMGMTDKYIPENVQSEIARIESELNKPNQQGLSFKDEFEKWAKYAESNTANPQGKDIAEKFVAANKDKYNDLVSSLEDQKRLLPQEGEPEVDPYADLDKNLVADVKAFYDDDNYEEVKDRWVKNNVHTAEELTLAENKYIRDEQDLKTQKEILNSPEAILGSSGFYANKQKKDEVIRKGLLEHQTAFQKKLNDQYKGEFSAIQQNYQTKAQEELNTTVEKLQGTYQKQFNDIIANDEDARVLTGQFQQKLSTATPEQKEGIQKLYNEALSTLPEIQKLKEAQSKELKSAQEGVINKYDVLLKKDYNSTFDKAQKDFQAAEMKWVAKQYDPVVNDKSTLTKWTDSVKKDMNLGDMDHTEKKQFLKKEWSSYLKTEASKDPDFAKKMANPTIRKQAETEFYTQFGDQLVDKKGKPTVYGMKSMAESSLENVNEQIKNLKGRFDNASGDKGVIGIAQSEVGQKMIQLVQAKENFEKIIAHPETDEGFFTDVWSGLTSKNGIEYIPFVATINSIGQGLNVKAAADKLADGKTLSFEEQSLLNSVAAQRSITEMRPTSTAYNIGSGIAATLPAIVEFVSTSGAYTVTKKALTKGIESQFVKQLEKNLVKEGVYGTAGKAAQKDIQNLITTGYAKQGINGLTTFVGSVAHTVANPQQIADKLIGRMTPQVALAFTDEGNKMEAQLESKGEDFWTAFAKATGSTWADMVTERMGTSLMKTGGDALNKVIGNKDWFKRSALGSWMSKRGIKSTDDAMKTMMREKLGWNGIIEENLEEYTAHALDALITGDHSMVMTGKEALETFGVTAGLGGAVFKPVKVIAKNIKDLNTNQVVHMTTTDEKGKKQLQKELTIPRPIWNDYKTIVNDKNVSEGKLEAFLTKTEMPEETKDAMRQDYFGKNKNKAEALLEQAKAKETTVPKPKVPEKAGFDGFVDNPKFSSENPLSAVPQEIYDLNESIQSGKPDKKLLNETNMHMAESWARNSRDKIVKNENLSPEEKENSLTYLNDVISNIETEHELSQVEETVSTPPSELSTPVENVTAPVTETKTTPKETTTSKEAVSTAKEGETTAKDQRTVIKERNVKKNEAQTVKIAEAEKVVNTPIYGNEELREKAIESVVAHDDLMTELNKAQTELSTAEKKETNLGSYTSRKKRVDVNNAKAKVAQAQAKVNEAKKNIQSSYSEYGKSTNVNPSVVHAEVKEEIEYRKSQGTPVVKQAEVKPVEKPKVTIDPKKARNTDIADLKSGNKELTNEVLGTLELEPSELADAKKDLDLKGNKSDNIKDLFEFATKKRKISEEKFYDVAKKYRNRNFTVAQKAKEAEQGKKDKAKRIAEEKASKEKSREYDRKGKPVGTEATKQAEPKKEKPVKKVSKDPLQAIEIESQNKQSTSKKTEAFEKTADILEAKEVDVTKLKETANNKDVKSIVKMLKDLRKNIRNISSPDQLVKEAKIDGEIFGAKLLDLHKKGIILRDEMLALNQMYSDISNDVTILNGVERDALEAETQAFLYAKAKKNQGRKTRTSNPIVPSSLDERIESYPLPPNEEALSSSTGNFIKKFHAKLFKALRQFHKNNPNLKGFKKVIANNKLSNAGGLISAKAGKAGSPMAVFSVLQRYVAMIGAGANDLNGYAHEMGHLIDASFDFSSKTGLNVPEAQMTPEAKALYDELKTLYKHGPTISENPTQQEIVKEGLAEAMRAVSINPQYTAVFYPEFYKQFNSNVPVEIRALMNSEGSIGEYFRMADSMTNLQLFKLNQNNAEAQVKKEKSEKRKKIKKFIGLDSVGHKFKYRIPTWFMEKIVDDRYQVQQMLRILQIYLGDDYKGMKDPEKLMSLLSGVGIKANAQMKEGLRDKFGNLKYDDKTKQVISYDWMRERLSRDSAKDRQEAEDTITSYMNAQRFVELQERDINDQIDTIQNEIDNLDAEIASGKLSKNEIADKEAKKIRLENSKKKVKASDNIINFTSGLASNQAAAHSVIKEIEDLKNTNPKLYDDIQETTRRYRVLAFTSLKYLVDQGKMSEAEYDIIKNKNQAYVALNRIVEQNDFESSKETRFKRSSVTSEGFKINKVEGSSKATQDPFISLFINHHKIVKEADRNYIFQQITDMITEVASEDPALSYALGGTLLGTTKPGEQPILKPEDSNTPIIKVYKQKDGETIVEHWKFDESTTKSLEALDGLSAFVPIVTPINNFFKRIYTSTPKFLFDNFFRDTIERVMVSNTGSGLRGIQVGKKFRDEKAKLASTGGSQSYAYENYQSAAKVVKDYNDSVMKKSNWRYTNPMHYINNYRKALRAVENSNRVSEFRHSRKKYEKQMLDNLIQKNNELKKQDPNSAEIKSSAQMLNEAHGHAMVMAAYDARNLMDFYRAGSAMRYINQLIPFANAGVQGASRYMQSVQRASKDPKYMAMFAMRNIIWAGIAEVAFKAIQDGMTGDDDDEALRLLEQQDYLKNKYFTIPTKYGDFTIAKPYSGWLFGNLAGRIYDSVVRGDELASENNYGLTSGGGRHGSLEGLGIPTDFSKDNYFGLGTYFGEGALVDFSKALGPVQLINNLYHNRNSFGGTIIPPEQEIVPVAERDTERQKHKRNTLSGAIEDIVGVDARNTDEIVAAFGQWGKLFNEAVINNLGNEGKQTELANVGGFIRKDDHLFSSESYKELKNNSTYKYALEGKSNKGDEDIADKFLGRLEKEYYLNKESDKKKAKEIATKISKTSRIIKQELNARIEKYGTASTNTMEFEGRESDADAARKKMREALDRIK